MTTTLVLTRKPNSLFRSSLFRTQNGRFGTLVVLQGAPVTSVTITATDEESGGDAAAITVPSGVLDVTTSEEGGVEEVGRYTTIERMDGYIQLKPQEFNGRVYKTGAYGLNYEPNNPVVAELAGTGGRCFRVTGGITAQERAILIHEAPHVGYLLGCIGPRTLNDTDPGYTGSSHSAMTEMFALTPRPSALFVLDW